MSETRNAIVAGGGASSMPFTQEMLAKATGVNSWRLRKLEREGVIKPLIRTKLGHGSTVVFGDETVDQVKAWLEKNRPPAKPDEDDEPAGEPAPRAVVDLSPLLLALADIEQRMRTDFGLYQQWHAENQDTLRSILDVQRAQLDALREILKVWSVES